MPSIQVPREWEQINPADMAGTIVVIGDTDSGKSTFVRWLVSQLCRHHERVGWLDADVGQSTLGVPTTMSLAVVNALPDSTPRADASFFVGNTSPRGHMLPQIVGAHKLQGRAREMGVDAIVVDTTGLVAQEAGGGALKQWKVALLKPNIVIAIQRHGELAHILAPLVRDSRRAVHTLTVADAVSRKSTEERIARRRRRFQRYFAGASVHTINYSRLPVYDLDQAGPQRLLALLDARGFARALGVIAEMTRNEMTVRTPLRSADDVAGIRIGSLRLNPDTGEEKRS